MYINTVSKEVRKGCPVPWSELLVKGSCELPSMDAGYPSSQKQEELLTLLPSLSSLPFPPLRVNPTRPVNQLESQECFPKGNSVPPK